MADFMEYREQVLAAARLLVERGLLAATGGNVSVRIEGEDMLAVTPSSKDYSEMTAVDVCVCDFKRKLVAGTLNPSVETGMHISVYQARPDVNAVLHTHQIGASVFSLIGMGIPALFDEQVVNLGREAAFVPYGLSGSTDLLNNITKALENKCNAYILQTHGALTLATDMDQAIRNAMIFEKIAQVYSRALAMGREITTVPDQMANMLIMLLDGRQKTEIMRKKKLGMRTED